MENSTRFFGRRAHVALLLPAVQLLLEGCTRRGAAARADMAARSSASGDVPGPTLQARAIEIFDGDSLHAQAADGAPLQLRIGGIDAPEKDQPYGVESRRHLQSLLADTAFSVAPIKRDPYGRTVARIHARGEDVALLQLQAGLAWHFKRFEADQSPDERARYRRAQRLAKAQRLGLWNDARPEPPWAFRDARRGASS